MKHYLKDKRGKGKIPIISPSRFIIYTYITIIFVGALVLFTPFSSSNISFIDALFTSTSAFCVTGLIVKNTPMDFTLFGKIFILLLIQFGGLGYMVFSNIVAIMLRKKLTLRDLTLTKEEYHIDELGDVKRIIKWIIITTISVEIGGAIILYAGFNKIFDTNKAIFQSVFHSVSAFCNAGFSLIQGNLEGFYRYPFIILTISFLFIIGGLGFITIRDLALRILNLKRHTFSQTKMVLLVTSSLIVFFTLFILFTEWKNSLLNFNLKEKLLISFFMATSPRTAGFNVISINLFLPITLIFIMVGMYIGASPGGTGGGIKTTTFGAILFWIISNLKGEKDTNFINRRFSEKTVNRAILLVFLSIFFIFIITSTLIHIEKDIYNTVGFLPIAFEVFSAFGTVGLSYGSINNKFLSLSNDFSTFGKILIIILMMVGKIGTLTITSSMIVGKKTEKMRLTVSKMQIG